MDKTNHALLPQRLAVFSLSALIALCLAWELWFAPLREGGSWLALKALPLCLPLAGVLKGRGYTFQGFVHDDSAVFRRGGDAFV